jgi:hypothetical protein
LQTGPLQVKDRDHGQSSMTSTARMANGFGLQEFWSTGVHEIPNSKHQITNKSQIPIPNDRNRFRILNFGHCYLFDICDLLFGIFSHSITPADSRAKERLLRLPWGGVQSQLLVPGLRPYGPEAGPGFLTNQGLFPCLCKFNCVIFYLWAFLIKGFRNRQIKRPTLVSVKTKQKTLQHKSIDEILR